MSNPIKIKATISSIEQFGKDTYKLRFEPYGTVPKFKVGQFLHLAIDEYDPMGGFWPESRVFSIASAPGGENIEILYSVRGQYTARMQSELRVGSEVWLKLPYGTFVVDNFVHPGQDAVLIAGGTGISPFLPYLEAWAPAARAGIESLPNRISLYYGVRENKLLAALDILDRISDNSSFCARVFVENEAPIYTDKSNVSFRRGKLAIKHIYEEAHALRDPVFFLSGPPAMIFSFKKELLDYGVVSENVVTDEWE